MSMKKTLSAPLLIQLGLARVESFKCRSRINPTSVRALASGGEGESRRDRPQPTVPAGGEKNRHVLFAMLVAGFAAAATPTQARAPTVEEIYPSKTVNMIIGYSVGGGYDLYGRLVARHIGKHIPGKPNVVPQNMTGAGSLRAAQYIYSVAPRDGMTIGTFGRTIATTPLLTPASAQFDGTKFTWLGSVTNEVSTCVTWHTSPVKAWSDILTKEVAMGGEGPGADPDVYALLYKNVFGAKVKLVTGYHGTNDTTLAMERGEVDG